MADSLGKLSERRMLKAMAEGKLQGLEGEGAPLPDRSGEAFVDAGEAVGYRVMAEAGALPEEIRIKHEIYDHKKAMAKITEPDARKEAMAKLADLMMKLSIAEDARRRFMR